MGEGELLPPGRHPSDPSKQDIDAVGFALGKIQTLLLWIDEHRASFEKHRNTDPSSAEAELHNLEISTRDALTHFQRLKELLLAGYTIDPNKRLSKGLNSPHAAKAISTLTKPPLQP